MTNIILERKGKSTLIKEDGEQPLIEVKCFIPFGVEYYNYNKIVNLEFLDNNNDHFNSINIIKTYEEKILDALPEEMKKNRQYNGIFYKRKNSILLRTYLDKKKNNNIDTTLKKVVCTANIQFTSVWASKTSYGIMINLKDLEQI